jgi:hypothetical protein
LLGLAPSLLGAVCEEVSLRLLHGLPPFATGDSVWEVAQSRPRGRLVTGLESSDGAAHPSGGLVASPHSVAERASSPDGSSATAPYAATVAAAPLVAGGTAATVEQAYGAPPGPTRATTTHALAALVSMASTLHESPASPLPPLK